MYPWLNLFASKNNVVGTAINKIVYFLDLLKLNFSLEARLVI